MLKSIGPFRTSGVKFDPFRGFASPTPVVFCLFEAAMKKKTVQRLFKYKNRESAIFSAFTTKKFPISFWCHCSRICSQDKSFS